METTGTEAQAVSARWRSDAMEADRRDQPRGVARALPRAIGRAAIGVGLFGIGLGLAELLAPRRFNGRIGVGENRRARNVTRALGLREIANSIALLGRRFPAPWLWARVGGDIVDLALLANATRARRARVGRIVGAIGAVVGATVVDALVAGRSSGRARARLAGPVRRAITIASSSDAAYRFWRELGNLPKFMERIESVEELASGRSRWRLRAPKGMALSWEAEIVEDRSAEIIRWQSVEGSEVTNRGAVRFRPAPGGQGTEIAVELEYVPPAGELGRLASFLSNEALEVQLERDLRRLKQLLEVGEIVRSDARSLRERQRGVQR
jgi:uncharacterized membrane protein